MAPVMVRRLRELIAAIDRRRPQSGQAGEPAIARASAALRAEAVQKLQQRGRGPTGRRAKARL